MRVEQQFVTLENYISLLQNQDEQDQITIKHLNQRVLVDAVNSIEVLLNPFRSTISEKISPASLSKEEIVNDLSILDWKDCAVQRIESVVVNTTLPSECLTKSPIKNHGMDKSFTPEEKKKRSYTKKKDKIHKKKKGLMESEFPAAATEKEQKRRYRKKEKGSLESGFTAVLRRLGTTLMNHLLISVLFRFLNLLWLMKTTKMMTPNINQYLTPCFYDLILAVE
ncbi:hypothetical protein C5167_030751 [Papaver somniferum]|uniref:uncharacterized protein LOC113335034 n=1 Tax=Papaver somniferum TaxID=3469 RepID=UPI000E6FAEB5|nr:uncharacterized protein LOC113335034 [Papaver somniferum]RZC89061.1 hypothetical protein C5167_030751 [Papaver somniferum]